MWRPLASLTVGASRTVKQWAHTINAPIFRRGKQKSAVLNYKRSTQQVTTHRRLRAARRCQFAHSVRCNVFVVESRLRQVRKIEHEQPFLKREVFRLTGQWLRPLRSDVLLGFADTVIEQYKR